MGTPLRYATFDPASGNLGDGFNITRVTTTWLASENAWAADQDITVQYSKIGHIVTMCIVQTEHLSDTASVLQSPVGTIPEEFRPPRPQWIPLRVINGSAFQAGMGVCSIDQTGKITVYENGAAGTFSLANNSGWDEFSHTYSVK